MSEQNCLVIPLQGLWHWEKVKSISVSLGFNVFEFYSLNIVIVNILSSKADTNEEWRIEFFKVMKYNNEELIKIIFFSVGNIPQTNVHETSCLCEFVPHR
jgi:hypothetical protein